MPPSSLTLSDVVFSEQANHNFSKILGDLKKANLSISNRLNSILQDAGVVEQVADVLGLPLVANERCGSWYIDPERKAASAYFKSTDGHVGQWRFSTRRLNLHLLELIGKRDGCIIVDSTRRGKRIPDALSKTVPIWCCVLNRVLFPNVPGSHELHVPPHAVSDSERSQIEARLPGFVEAFSQLEIDAAPLRAHLRKPLRPVWKTQDDATTLAPLGEALGAVFHPVVCCVSSRRVQGTEMSEGGYIQGAADDTENWAHGLTAPVFWDHRDELLATSEARLPELIASLVAGPGREASAAEVSCKQVSPCIAVGQLPVLAGALDANSCLVTLEPNGTASDTWVKSKRHMEVGLAKSKAGSRVLRDALPQICQFVAEFLGSEKPGELGEEHRPEKKIYVACQTGRDISVGVALALDCWLFEEDGSLRAGQGEPKFDKTAIRVRLGRIMQAMPEANPNRTTLQSVNSFLMAWRR